MDASYFLSPVIFVADTLVSFYIVIILLRFLGQWVAADFHNPLFQFTIRLTHPLLRPLRRLIPPLGRVDTAAVVLMLTLQTMDNALLAFLQTGGIPAAGALLLGSVARWLELVLNAWIFMILIQAAMSWFSMGYYHPAATFLRDLTEPLLRPARSLLPPFSGIDLSPLLVLLALQVVKMLALPLLM
ncbi:MAG TPA: YggT family protein [Methylococcaceae bacterium]|nr:YggT family protein [Methylococcaceae bacterium]